MLRYALHDKAWALDGSRHGPAAPGVILSNAKDLLSKEHARGRQMEAVEGIDGSGTESDAAPMTLQTSESLLLGPLAEIGATTKPGRRRARTRAGSVQPLH